MLFKTTSDIQHLVNNPYIHQIWVQEGIFTLKLKGYASLGVIKETFNLSDLSKGKAVERAPDKENPTCYDFVMKDKSSGYGKAVELVNSFINYAKFNKDKLHRELFTYGGIEKCIFAINRYFEPHESKDFNKQLLELVSITDNDKLILLQDVPKNRHSSALNTLKGLIKFWGFDVDLPIYKFNSKGVAKLDNIQFTQWLEFRGFRTYFINGHNSEIVRIVDNKASKVSDDLLINYLSETLKSGDVNSYNAFMSAPHSTLIKAMLKTLPKVANIGIKSNQFTSYHAFLNGVVMVDKGMFKLIPYHELPFVIWESEIIQHELNVNCDIDTLRNSRFARFFNAAVGKEQIHIFGYLSHKYKDSSKGKMVILTDSKPTDSAGEANGGTGKGLILRALSLFNTAVELEDFNGDNRFSLDSVTEAHNLIIIPDAHFEFNFRSLFNAITGTMVVQRKFKDTISIPFESSPKLVVATNHKINLSSESYNRRVIPIHLTTFFNNSDNTVDKYLGGRLFEGDFDEWNEFYLFCIYAVQKWLKIYSFDTFDNAIIVRLSEWVKPKAQVKKVDFDLKMKNVPMNIYAKYLADNGLKEVLISKYTQGEKPNIVTWEKIKW